MYEKRPWLAHYGNVPASLSYPEGSIYSMIAEDARRHPGLPALEFLGRWTSKAGLLARADAMSREE